MAEVGSIAGRRAVIEWSTREDQESARRADSLLGRALLRGVLERVAPPPARGWRIQKLASGRPLLVGEGVKVPSVSASHSGDWVACAVSFDGDIGIDIERMRSDRDLTGIAARAFGPAECAEVKAGGCARFYAVWTLREAIAKAVGIGLAMAADGQDRVAGVRTGDFREVVIDDAPWQVLQRIVAPDLSLAVALRGAAAPRLQWWFETTSSA
jgi:4'-phosphopantetheinyl transferase